MCETDQHDRQVKFLAGQVAIIIIIIIIITIRIVFPWFLYYIEFVFFSQIATRN